MADTRIHGTTCKQVATLFAEERPHLGQLPAMLFPCYQEARRTVGRDSFVEVAKSFYEAPPEYIGRQVWVRWDGRVVRILNERLGLTPPAKQPLREWQLHNRRTRHRKKCGLTAGIFTSRESRFPSPL